MTGVGSFWLIAFMLASPVKTPSPSPTPAPHIEWLKRPLPDPEAIRKACPDAAPTTPIIEAHLMADGTVSEVKVARGSGCKGADRLLAQSLRAWRFKPVTEAGKPINLWLTMTFFDLAGR